MTAPHLRKNTPVLLIALLAILLLNSAVMARYDDPAYHNLDDIYTEIIALQDSFPNYFRLDTIGYSQQEGLPIWAVLVNQDVNDADRVIEKPSVIINGQYHAEEILGVEYCMWLLQKIATRQGRDWRRNINTWIIPTANPEGLKAVYTIDNTYRKNKRDNIGDGMFRFEPGWGFDTSGVDINRNFPTFWVHGNKFLALGTNEYYDYYRGPAPASEAETRAIIAFYDKIRPVYSLTLHSSRTGNVAEKVIYPFGWGVGDDLKLAPDIEFYDEWANQIGLRCNRFGDAGKTYQVNRIKYPRGDAEQFVYMAFGTFSCRIEIGQKGDGMQPDSAGIQQIISDVSLGLELMLNSAAGIDFDDKGEIITSRLDFQIRNANTLEPIYARLSLDSRSSAMLPYRYTNPASGYYYWMVTPDILDTLRVNSFGYKSVAQQVFSGTGSRRIRVNLDPLPWHDFQLNITDTEGNLFPETVELTVTHADTSWTQDIYDGITTLHIPTGNYQFSLYNGTHHVPRTIKVAVDSSAMITIPLSHATVLFAENFDGGDVVHTSDDILNKFKNDSLVRWELTREIFYSSPKSLTDTRIGATPIFEDGWDAPYNLFEQSLNLENVETAMLTYRLNQSLEPGHDSLIVEVSLGSDTESDPANWEWEQVGLAQQKLAILNWRDMDDHINRSWNANTVNLMNYHDWEKVVISLDDFVGNPKVHFRFRIKTDGFYQEDGVYIDDVFILVSDESPAVTTSELPVPEKFTMGSPYPNPFNGQLSVGFNLPEAGEIQLRIFDIRGREVYQRQQSFARAGSYRTSINAISLSSGVYFLRAEMHGETAIAKIMLLK
jgi:hypothetical protein